MQPKQRTVLVVADDHQLSIAVERVIERRDLAEVVVAWDATQAKALIDGINFEAVVIDADLPRGAGLKLMVEVANSHPGVRRVAMGKAARKHLEELVFAELVDAAVAKPIDGTELLDAVFANDESKGWHNHHQERVSLRLGARQALRRRPTELPSLDTMVGADEVEPQVISLSDRKPMTA